MAKRISSSLPDLRKSSLGSLEDKEGFEEKTKKFEEVSKRNADTKQLPQKLPFSYNWVSRWERRRVEKYLHICYNKFFSDTPVDLFGILNIDEINEEQREYIENIKKYLHFSTTASTLHYFGDAVVQTKVMPRLKELDDEPKEYIRLRVHKFLADILYLVDELDKLKTDSEAIGNIANAYEGLYTRLFSSFAEMCCLKPKLTICKADHSIWKNFRGIDTVISRPGIRLYKHGVTTKSSIDLKTVVSVVEVTKDRCHTDDSTDSEGERCRSSKSSSTNSYSDEGGPQITWLLRNKILGQHVGELLVDLHVYGKKDKDLMMYYMPGIIVKDSEVVFTVLEISSSHYKKLEANEMLTDDDKATVFYSKPYDFLQEDLRNILIENLVRLNNITF